MVRWQSVHHQLRATQFPVMQLDAAPYRLSGAVFAALLNHRSALAALGDAIHRAPYDAAPQAPILYVRPRNTFAGMGNAIIVPEDAPLLDIGATLGVVIGRAACRVLEEDAFGYIAGYLIANDISVPHDNFYRPSIRCRARDGFCPMGSFVPRKLVRDPSELSLRVIQNDELRQLVRLADLVRPVPRLVADVTEFMTLSRGDVLLVGTATSAPQVCAGQSVTIEVEGLGSLTNSFVDATA